MALFFIFFIKEILLLFDDSAESHGAHHNGFGLWALFQIKNLRKALIVMGKKEESEATLRESEIQDGKNETLTICKRKSNGHKKKSSDNFK